MELVRQLYLVCFHGVRWFGCLTRGFAGYFGVRRENEQRQQQKTRAIYRSLRPSGFTPDFGRMEAAARRVLMPGRPKAKALGYQPRPTSEATAKARAGWVSFYIPTHVAMKLRHGWGTRTFVFVSG